jgi:hypothetical protein
VAGYDADTGELVAKALGWSPASITADRMTRLWMTAPYRAEETPARAAADRSELEHRRCRKEA